MCPTLKPESGGIREETLQPYLAQLSQAKAVTAFKHAVRRCVCLLNVCILIRASRASEVPFLHDAFMAVINPLYEPRPLLRLQMLESRIFLSTKDKLFFQSPTNSGKKKLLLHPPQNEIVWGVYYMSDIQVCICSATEVKNVLFTEAPSAALNPFWFYTHTPCQCEPPGNHSMCQRLGEP